ncbi:AI-2E family transporter [Aureitalea marina]|uniref:AI-2E family transporter n=1 Tax=Aureitalea marina TaxID=930804 RepID=A0A2S7KQK1_9FLAO|nr:AI-2E family transporter [Aureitalea marina]PQB04896.1 AI-2E family transporter [Aureitalea marina]
MNRPNQIPVGIIQQLLVLLLIAIFGGLIFWELLPYLSGVLGAITLYVLMRGPMVRLVKRGWGRNFTATILCILSFFVILLPLSGVFAMLGSKVAKAVQNSERVISIFQKNLNEVETYLGIPLGSDLDIGAITSWLTSNLQSVAGGTFNAILAVGLMYFILFYLLTERAFRRSPIFSSLPFSKENMELISEEIQAMVKSNAIGIPLVAIIQGIFALIGFLIFGTDEPFFWAVIVTIGSTIPYVGTAIGIVPVFIISLSAGDNFAAWGVLIYGIVVVGTSDNLVRLYLLKKLDDVHPLITLVGIVVGVPLFGFIGLIFGPLMISLFLLLLKIYHKEYGQNEPIKEEVKVSEIQDASEDLTDPSD